MLIELWFIICSYRKKIIYIRSVFKVFYVGFYMSGLEVNVSDVRLLYVSKLKDCANPMNELFNILTEALDFNNPNQIYGALYYGNNYFVQCLEGDKEKVEHLFYNKILRDIRHEQCEIMFFENINERLFSNWHMKYAIFHKDILRFFCEHHLDEFNPYLLNTGTIPNFIDLLAKQPDSYYSLKQNC